MTRRVIAVVVALACTTAACSSAGSDVPTPAELQADLAQRSVTLVISGGVHSGDREDIVDRATRGSVLPFDAAIWVYEGEITARGSQGQALVDRPVWAVYFSDVEQFGLGEPGAIRSDWVVFVDKESETIVLGPTAAGVTTIETTPPRTPAFEVRLPDRGARSGPGGAWALSVVPGEAIRMTVVVTVPPDVVIQSMSFVILAGQSGTESWRRTVASHLPTGTYRFTLMIDGQGLDRGVYDFAATWDVWHRGIAPGRYGHRLDDDGVQWLGWVDIARP